MHLNLRPSSNHISVHSNAMRGSDVFVLRYSTCSDDGLYASHCWAYLARRHDRSLEPRCISAQPPTSDLRLTICSSNHRMPGPASLMIRLRLLAALVSRLDHCSRQGSRHAILRRHKTVRRRPCGQYLHWVAVRLVCKMTAAVATVVI